MDYAPNRVELRSATVALAPLVDESNDRSRLLTTECEAFGARRRLMSAGRVLERSARCPMLSRKQAEDATLGGDGIVDPVAGVEGPIGRDVERIHRQSRGYR
jgi:hypothetical protein